MNANDTNTNPDPVLAQALAWAREGRGVALATVTRTWGSAPRRAGSHMAIADDGDFTGSVSGGCIEGAVIDAGLAVIESRRPRTLEFGVTNEMAWEVGLACGGRVHLFVEAVGKPARRPQRGAGPAPGQPPAPHPDACAMTTDLLRQLVDAERAGIDGVVATRLTDGAKELVLAAPSHGGAAARTPPAAASPAAPHPRPAPLPGLDDDAIARVLETGEPSTVATPRGDVFLRPHIRPPRLIVVGAVHIAQALVPMATIAGFRVTVLDPRDGFATAERFPGATLVGEWPDDAMAVLQPDDRTAMVALTHDPRIDDPALIAALKSDAFYIGALGSRKTQASRRDRLHDAGFTASDLARIHGPIGLPIGARTPEEIAVAVLAQAIEALRRPRE